MHVVDLEGDPRKLKEGARKRGCIDEQVAAMLSPVKDSLKDCVEHSAEG